MLLEMRVRKTRKRGDGSGGKRRRQWFSMDTSLLSEVLYKQTAAALKDYLWF
jgi:hypothetical protein